MSIDMSTRKGDRASKRLVVLSDGTWQSLQNQVHTNVLWLTLSISPEDDEGIQQIIFYDPGVGTDDSLFDKVVGGATGMGIDKNIKQLYTFLCLNYDDGDEIYLFGFSRGAYTVRSLAGMINNAGLVRRKEATFIDEAYEIYRKKLSVDAEEAVAFRKEHGDRVPITLLACFDTVGSLGLPFSGPFIDRKRYEFHDTTLCGNTENAIHMLSIDETRKSYAPTMMDAHPDVPNQLSQLYFWGGHSGVGGGDEHEEDASKVTLLYCIEEISRRKLGLKVDQDILSLDPNFDCEVPELSSMRENVTRFLTGTEIRQINSLKDLHPTVKQRFIRKKEWRPKALMAFEEELMDE